jgi:hypothetical protein
MRRKKETDGALLLTLKLIKIFYTKNNLIFYAAGQPCESFDACYSLFVIIVPDILYLAYHIQQKDIESTTLRSSTTSCLE